MAKIVAIVNDLIFMTKIRNAAEHFGLTVGFAGNENQIEHFLKNCKLVIIDLENDFLDSVDLIERLKKDPATASIKTIGYFSHINTPLKADAFSAGCNEILSRFEFNSNLKEILQSSCF
jgi:CheY-like chemotaxis protein